MNIRRISFVRLMALAVVALGLSTAMASAQAARGTFTLPTEAHWQKATLPAGEYSYTVDLMSAGPMVTVRSLQGGSAVMLLAASRSETIATSKRDLVLTSVNGAMFVSSFRLGDMGLELNYILPKETQIAVSPSAPPAMLAASR